MARLKSDWGGIRYGLGKIKTSGDRAYGHVEYLAETIGPRPSGSRRALDAAKYIREELDRCGLEVQTDPLRPLVFAHGRSHVEVLGPKPVKLGAIPLMFSGTTGAGVSRGDLAYVGARSASELSRMDLGGKIVLAEEPRGNPFLAIPRLIRACGEAGAAGVIIHARSGGPKSFSLEPGGENPPSVFISSEDAFRLLGRLASRGKCRIAISVSAKEVESKNSQNVRAFLGPKGGYGRVVVCAHYDTVIGSPGANDNGSGVACMLESARALAEAGHRGNVEFIAFDAEEPHPYCLGSRRYVESFGMEPGAIKCAIAIDMVGVGVKMGNAPALKSLYREGYHRGKVARTPGGLDSEIVGIAKGLGVSLERLEKVGLSDHVPFLMAGIDASLLRWMDDPFYHTPDDRAVNVDPNKLGIISSIAANSAAVLSRPVD
ncbi:MAG: M20/M25/M40 family metallo-hydrolase [Candidatus Bathyarchaeia archaeon]